MSGMMGGDLAQLDVLRKTFGDQVQAPSRGCAQPSTGHWARHSGPGRPPATVGDVLAAAGARHAHAAQRDKPPDGSSRRHCHRGITRRVRHHRRRSRAGHLTLTVTTHFFDAK